METNFLPENDLEKRLLEVQNGEISGELILKEMLNVGAIGKILIMNGIDSQIDKVDLSILRSHLERLAQGMIKLENLQGHESDQISSALEQLSIILSLYLEKFQLRDDFLATFDDLNFEFEVLDLLQSFKEICYSHQQTELFHHLNEWILAFTLWRVRHGGRIQHLDYIVNSIAEIANRLREEDELSFLANITHTVVSSVTEEISQDMISNSPSRPWRVLLLDYGIVATRSHQPKLMEQAYNYLAEHLPEDAGPFFAEGMKQMDVLNYPPRVRRVVEQFYKLYAVDNHSHKIMH